MSQYRCLGSQLQPKQGKDIKHKPRGTSKSIETRESRKETVKKTEGGGGGHPGTEPGGLSTGAKSNDKMAPQMEAWLASSWSWAFRNIPSEYPQYNDETVRHATVVTAVVKSQTNRLTLWPDENPRAAN